MRSLSVAHHSLGRILGSLLLLLGVQCSKTDSNPSAGKPVSSAPLGSTSGAVTRGAASSESLGQPGSPEGSARPPTDSAPSNPPPGTGEPLNVILLTIDSLRADMPWTGYSRPIAPFLTQLAERSAVYTRAYSASSYTAKSVATFLSGRYPSTLYRDGFFFAKYSNANKFMAEILSERGVRTIGFHGHLYFGRGKGLEQGFAEWHLVPGITFDAQTDKHVTSEKMTELGIQLLKNPANTAGQFFAWAHYMDPHDEYNKHAESPDFGRKGRDRYDSEVWYTDHWVSKLIAYAEQQPWWKRTVLIVSADHGEAFGEHDMYKHAFELWEVLTHVPLLVTGPGVRARRIDERRSHIDLAPTILDLMGVPVPPDMQGESLVPELRGATPTSREPILTELTEDSHNPPRRALIDGDYKLIDFGRSKFQLFDLKADPGELSDLSKQKPEELARMRKLLEERYKKLPTVEPYGGAKLKEGGTARGPIGPSP
ncbi:MAG TPA: sulfatase [Polyangiaceae bacterium]|nr:sulfatase [Polyangiaceae bacterium]